MKRHLYQSIKAPTKKDFDCLRCEMTGLMRTQILAVAASLRLAEHLQDGGCTADDLAAEKVPLRTIKTTPLDNDYVVIETAAT